MILQRKSLLPYIWVDFNKSVSILHCLLIFKISTNSETVQQFFISHTSRFVLLHFLFYFFQSWSSNLTFDRIVYAGGKKRNSSSCIYFLLFYPPCALICRMGDKVGIILLNACLYMKEEEILDILRRTKNKRHLFGE